MLLIKKLSKKFLRKIKIEILKFIIILIFRFDYKNKIDYIMSAITGIDGLIPTVLSIKQKKLLLQIRSQLFALGQ